MGEAKRRKEILGDKYGKVKPRLTEGSKQEEIHCVRFHEALQEKITEIGFPGAEGEDKKFSLVEMLEYQKGGLADWVASYLESYHPEDREKLIISLWVVLYAQLEEMEEMYSENSEYLGEEEQEEFISWLLQSLMICQLSQPYLSEQMKEEITFPLKSLYHNFLDSKPDAGDDNSAFEEVLQVFASLFEADTKETSSTKSNLIIIP